MMTKNFSLKEMQHSNAAVTYKIKNECPKEFMPNLQRTADFLQKIRDALETHYDREIKITVLSGYRSPETNAKVGGAKNSDHMKGMAADIVAEGLSSYQLAKFIKDNVPGYHKLIQEFGRWVHVSVSQHPEERLLTATKKKVGGKLATIYVPGILDITS